MRTIFVFGFMIMGKELLADLNLAILAWYSPENGNAWSKCLPHHFGGCFAGFLESVLIFWRSKCHFLALENGHFASRGALSCPALSYHEMLFHKILTKDRSWNDHVLCFHTVATEKLSQIQLHLGKASTAKRRRPKRTIAWDKMCETSQKFKYRLDSGSGCPKESRTHFGIDVSPF